MTGNLGLYLSLMLGKKLCGKSKLVDIVEKKKINREILEEEIKRASTGSVKQTKKNRAKRLSARRTSAKEREKTLFTQSNGKCEKERAKVANIKKRKLKRW